MRAEVTQASCETERPAPTTMRTLNTIVRFVITMAKLAPICWAGAKQAASERG